MSRPLYPSIPGGSLIRGLAEDEAYGVAILPDWKPPERIVDPDAGKSKLIAEGECRICERRPSGHPLDKLNRMHVVGKGQGGDDVEDNIVPGCGSGTTGCHGLLTSGREDPHHPAGLSVAEARDRMNRRLTDRERAYAESVKWVGWLETTYPRRWMNVGCGR